MSLHAATDFVDDEAAGTICCQLEDTLDMARLLAESFTQHDPPAVAVVSLPPQGLDSVSNKFDPILDLLGVAEQFT